MDRRSIVSPGTVLKGFQILAPHPWIVTKLISLQLAKWFYPLTAGRAGRGLGGRIHQLSVRITDLCNLRCHTCGQWGDQGFMHRANLREHKLQEISAPRYLELFEDLVRHGHRPNVYLWGGEPSLYKELKTVIQGATALRLPTSIATNGHGLAGSAEWLVEAPLFLLQISIDGHDRVTHNRARPAAGAGDSFADLSKGLQAVKAAKKKAGSGLPLVASLTVVSRHNVDHLVEIYEKFKDVVDICIFYLSWWIDEENAEAHDRDFQERFGFLPRLHRGWIGGWRPDDYHLLSDRLNALRRLSAKRKNPAVTLLPNLLSVLDLQKYYTDHRQVFGFNQCISVFQAVEIDSNGDISPCRDYHDYVVGNIRQNTITELWNSPRYREFRKSLHHKGLMPACRRCCGLMGY